MKGIKIDCTLNKDIAYQTRKKELVEFCFNWCKRLPKCGILYDHVVSGNENCSMFKSKHHVQKPVKITGVENGRFIFSVATKEEVNQMRMFMPKVGDPK